MKRCFVSHKYNSGYFVSHKQTGAEIPEMMLKGIKMTVFSHKFGKNATKHNAVKKLSTNHVNRFTAIF
jgi:hypothetical protein